MLAMTSPTQRSLLSVWLSTLGYRLRQLLGLVLLVGTVAVVGWLVVVEAGLAIWSYGWPTTTAQIEKMASGIHRTRSRQYLPLSYVYRIGGNTYTSDRICFFEMFFGCYVPFLEQLLADYDEGDTIQVYYAPSWPALSVITRPDGLAWLGFIIALPLVAFGALILVGISLLLMGY